MGKRIGAGDRVLFWGENRPEWIACFYGCLLRGAVVVPLDLKSAPDFVARVQQQVSAKLLLLADEPQPQLNIPRVAFNSVEAATISCPGANGLVRRILLGTPWIAQSWPPPPVM